MSQLLRRLIPQARTLITKESFRDQSFGSLDGYIEDILRPIDIEPLVCIVQTAMKIFPPRDEESDAWLAPRVHASLRLFRSEAADQGIWDYLSVVVLRDYVIWRMAGEDGLVNDVDRIIGPFRHQAVARLWWAAELSRNGADYRPTQQAFSSQNAVNYLTNIDAFHNRSAALAYIRFISHRSGTTPIKQRAIETGKTLNHVLTTIVLDSFAPDSGSDMVALERWIGELPDVTLMDSALPQGPNEPQVPEEKIYAVEQLLERLMEEHRWHEVVDWTERWIATEQSPELAETALPIVSSPGENESKDIITTDVANDAVEKDIVAKEGVLHERFVQALRDDLGVEPSDQTRDLFDQVSNENDMTHNPDGSTSTHRVEELSKDKKTGEAMPAPGSAVSQKAISVRSDEIPMLDKPSLTDLAESGDTHTPIEDTTESVYEALSKNKESAEAMPVSSSAVSVRSDETPALGKSSLTNPVELDNAGAAIVETLESMFEELSPEQQTIARRIFLQLIERGEGTVGTARTATIEELILRPEDQLPVVAMLQMLSDTHLITWDETAVRIADEALIREEKRLHEWLDRDREDLRVHRHLAQAAQEWEMMHRDSSTLYRGARLAQTLEWAKTNAEETSVQEREFLDASNQVAEREWRSLAEAETRRAAEEHRAAMQWRQRTFYLAAAMIIILLVVIVVVYLVLLP